MILQFIIVFTNDNFVQTLETLKLAIKLIVITCSVPNTNCEIAKKVYQITV